MYSTHTNLLAALALVACTLFGSAVIASAQSYDANSFSRMTDEWRQSGTTTSSTGLVELSGTEEVPPVATDTYGAARVAFDNADNTLYAVVGVANGNDITAAHLHCGDRGENGPAVVTLFSDSSGRDVNGILSATEISEENIANVNCEAPIGYDIDSVRDLSDAIQRGDIYLNVHDLAHPNGVIRGQLSTYTKTSADSDDRQRLCESHWNTWQNDHQYDSERWMDTDHGKECREYGYEYHDGKDGSGGAWYGSTSTHHDSYNHESDREWHDGKYDWDNEQGWDEDWRDEWKNDRNHDDNNYESDWNSWTHDDETPWNHEWNNGRDHEESYNEYHDEYSWRDDDHDDSEDDSYDAHDSRNDDQNDRHEWNDDDESYERRGGINLNASVASIRSSLRI